MCLERRPPSKKLTGSFALLSLALPALLAIACGGSSAPPPAESTWLKPSEGVKDASSGTEAERFFPLLDGMIYTYRTTNEVGEEGLLVARVKRIDKTHGELVYPRGARRFEYAPDGLKVVSLDGAAYVLKLPLAKDATWRGEHGGNARVMSVSERVETPAGVFTGCVQILEERLGDRPIRYATTFCPEVGVVLLEAATGANYERAQLKSYAAPLQMRPDGLDRIPVAPQGDPAQVP